VQAKKRRERESRGGERKRKTIATARNELSTKTGRNKDERMARSVLLGREARSLEIIIIAARRG